MYALKGKSLFRKLIFPLKSSFRAPKFTYFYTKPAPHFTTAPLRFFSNSAAASPSKPYLEPEVSEEVMKSLQEQITKISQCMATGKYRDAQQLLNLYHKELSIYFTSDHPAYCSYENNQGILFRLNGKFNEAYDLLYSVYNKYLKMFGLSHPSTVSVVINLATVLRDLKDYPQSVKFYEMAIQARRELEGDQSPSYAIALGMAAGAHRLNGDTDTAYQYLKEAYVILAQHYQTEECQPCALILNSMGMLYKQQEKYDRAADAYERCLNVREKLLGAAHPDTIAIRHNLGELYTIWGKPEQAKAYLEENVKQMEELKKQQEGHSHDHGHHHHHDGECNDPTHKH